VSESFSSLKFGHVTADMLQTSKVKETRVKITAW